MMGGFVHIKKSTSVSTLASVNMAAFDDVCILSIRAIVHLPINATPGVWGEGHKPIRQRAQSASLRQKESTYEPEEDATRFL